MPSDCYRVYVYQVWCWQLKPFSFYTDKPTNRQTRLDALPMPAAIPAWLMTVH